MNVILIMAKKKENKNKIEKKFCANVNKEHSKFQSKFIVNHYYLWIIVIMSHAHTQAHTHHTCRYSAFDYHSRYLLNPIETNCKFWKSEQALKKILFKIHVPLFTLYDIVSFVLLIVTNNFSYNWRPKGNIVNPKSNDKNW